MPQGEKFQLEVLRWIEKNGVKNFSLDYDSFIREIYPSVVECYKSSNYNLQEIGTKDRTSYNNPVAIDILYYIVQKNKSLLENLSENEKAFLSKLENEDTHKQSEVIEWLDLYGDNILEDVSDLSKSDKIPEELSNRLFDETLTGKYTPVSICQDIEKNLTRQTNYRLSFNFKGYSKSIDISINTKKDNKLGENFLDKIMRTVLMLPKFNINRIAETPTKINLYFSTKEKKCLTKDFRILGANHINSGLTFFKFRETSPIITTVYRNEEMMKVIIHELIHNYKYDFGFLEFNLKLSDFLNLSKDTKITPNESYTEIVALLLNTIVESYNFKKSGNYELFKVMLNYEVQFNLLQCARILKYYQFNNAADFFQPYDNKNRFKQNTNVFSYFFMKTALLLNTTELFDFFERYSNNFFLKRGNVYYIKSVYEKLIVKSLKRPQFKNGIEHFFKKLGKGRGFDSPKELCKTLRMTIFG